MTLRIRLQFPDCGSSNGCFPSVLYPSLLDDACAHIYTSFSYTQIDAAPFKAWYQTHYGVALGKKKAGKEGDAAPEVTKQSKHVKAKLAARQATRELSPELSDVRTLSPSITPIFSTRCHGTVRTQMILILFARKSKGIPRF